MLAMVVVKAVEAVYLQWKRCKLLLGVRLRAVLGKVIYNDTYLHSVIFVRRTHTNQRTTRKR